MTRSPDKFAAFVPHPRYGRRPNLTGLNPSPNTAGVQLHWNTLCGERVPNTAIAADLSRQTPFLVPITHYFDVIETCRDCHKRFLFFAEEQRHWYEELGFPLTSGCVRCCDCRKRQQHLARTRRRYETLFHVADRTREETLEMAECSLALIAAGLFSPRQTQRVRGLLKSIPADFDVRTQPRFVALRAGLRGLEQSLAKNQRAPALDPSRE